MTGGSRRAGLLEGGGVIATSGGEGARGEMWTEWTPLSPNRWPLTGRAAVVGQHVEALAAADGAVRVHVPVPVHLRARKEFVGPAIVSMKHSSIIM
jgi:hypothetical protein